MVPLPRERVRQGNPAYELSIRTIRELERGAKRPSGPARTLLRAIKADPRGVAAGVGGGLREPEISDEWVRYSARTGASEIRHQQ